MSNRPLDPAFVAALNHAMERGIGQIPQLMYILPSPHPDFDLREYYTRYISYQLDAPKRKALARFLAAISAKAPVGLL